MHLCAEVMAYSSVVGGGVLIIGNRGKGPMVGQIAYLCHTDTMRDRALQIAMSEAIAKALNDLFDARPTPVNRERQRGERRDAMTPAELTARGVRVKYIYAPDCDECGDTGWVYFSCGTPWRCKCQRKSRAALTTGENDD